MPDAVAPYIMSTDETVCATACRVMESCLNSVSASAIIHDYRVPLENESCAMQGDIYISLQDFPQKLTYIYI